MNIKDAKEEVKNAMIAYFSKDDIGNYVIPIEKQRPVFLMGPPGIGKTAIIAQVAQELGVGLVSYSMTHHTRQSALGLPFISHKWYAEAEYDISEYTMSEIVASVYELMEQTGKKEGILFLDEVNCVSETLAPAMLQFLQYKTFGRHRVPDGWIIVTAGNPTEYNNSVREFDIATWDRLKRINIEPNYRIWKEYAVNQGVHPAITTYLDIKNDDFYLVETTVDGKSFATARGWEDLSAIIKLYEEKSIPVKESLIEQYIQERRIAKDFSAYYDLFQKYRSDYQVDRIIDGTADKSLILRASSAEFDERLALLGLILSVLTKKIAQINIEEEVLKQTVAFLKVQQKTKVDARTEAEFVQNQIESVGHQIKLGKSTESMSVDEIRILSLMRKELEYYLTIISSLEADDKAWFELLKNAYNERLEKYRTEAKKVSENIDYAFEFVESAFGEDKEVVILVTELTTHKGAAHFISRHGSDGYFRHNQELLFYERRKEILMELDELDV